MLTRFDQFIERVHQLLQAGYESMKQNEIEEFNRKTEPDITAGLAMRIQQLLDDRAVPNISRAWSVADNAPEHQRHLPLTKQPPAKQLKLPDLNFRFAGQRDALYFRFEAKKLAGTGDYADLISHDAGLGRFLRKVYGREDAAGGLLGYVQTESTEIHAERVRTALAANPKRYKITRNGDWSIVAWKNGPKCCFRTVHLRDRGPEIVIFHSFLLFR